MLISDTQNFFCQTLRIKFVPFFEYSSLQTQVRTYSLIIVIVPPVILTSTFDTFFYRSHILITKESA